MSRPLRIVAAHVLLLAFLGTAWAVTLWDHEREVRIPTRGSVLALAFEPRGDLLVAAADDERMQLLSARGRDVVREIGEPGEGTVDLAFGSSGRFLGTASVDSKVRLRRFPSGELLQTIDVPGVVAVAVTQSGTLVTGRRDPWGLVRIEAHAGAPRECFSLMRAETVRFSPGGELVAFFVKDWGEVYVFSVETGERLVKARDLKAARVETEEETIDPPPVEGVRLAWDGRGELLATSAVTSSGVALLSPYEDRGPPPDPFEVPRWPGMVLESGGGPVAVSWDGKLLLAGKSGELFSLGTRARIRKGPVLAPNEHFTSLAISRNGVAAGALSRDVVLWRAGTSR